MSEQLEPEFSKSQEDFQRNSEIIVQDLIESGMPYNRILRGLELLSADIIGSKRPVLFDESDQPKMATDDDKEILKTVIDKMRSGKTFSDPKVQESTINYGVLTLQKIGLDESTLTAVGLDYLCTRLGPENLSQFIKRVQQLRDELQREIDEDDIKNLLIEIDKKDQGEQ